MPILTGKRLGPYEILSAIGAGGMGEVYQAHDTKLGRDVAIKVLPEAFAHDPERLSRFQREAKMLAALNHPNIATIYGLEHSDGANYLVMELVPGHTLAERVSAGPTPIQEAIAIAVQIAEALEAAHEKGVIHRDLKPANVKVTPEGKVKVLDFGLAKAFANDGGLDLSQSPTLTGMASEEGRILGTPAYMSPEQARGLPVDKRTDIWAFGCVCYEMLTGRTPFAGQTISDMLAAVLEREPDWSRLPEALPVNIHRMLQRCLEKDSKRRLRDMGDARFDLDEASVDGPMFPPSTSAVIRHKYREYLGWAAAALLLLVVGTAAPFLHRVAVNPVDLPIVRTAIELPDNQKLATGDSAYPLAVSSSGSMLAYVSEQEGRTQLYVRELSALEPKVIPGTAGAMHPFFSPDGQWVGFFASGALQKAAVAGGAPLRICNVPGVSVGAAWGPDNTIVLALRGSGLFKVNATGGTLQPLADTNPAAWPEILPDGKTVLFTTGFNAIATIPLSGGAKRIVARTTDSPLKGPVVLGTGSGTGGGIEQAQFVSSGYLIYGQSPGIVRALPFDLASLEPRGSPVSLVDSVEQARNGGGVYFAVSQSGLLVYASTGDRHQLVWVDRNGTVTPISTDREAFRIPRLSPDGKRIAVAINDETRRSDIWIYDGERGTKNRLTTEYHNLQPVWSPDGAHITFSSAGGLVEMPVDGSGTKEILLSRVRTRSQLAVGTNAYPTSWSPDGQNLMFQADELDLWVLPRGVNSVPRPLLVRSSNDFEGQFSPDGRWVAYVSDESGRYEVYVGRYPDFANRVAISTDGGLYPRWSRNERELFYRQGDALMAVTVDTKQGFRAEKPRRLFAGQFSGAGRDTSFDVATDGRRFVMVKSDEASTLRQLTVVQNWFEELKQKVPLGK
jgi:eukaryotic-like serine/threonine-protein kinase